MIVSMMQVLIEIPESFSIKDKRQVVNSIKETTIRKFRLSCAEVDLQDSLRFAQLGLALVSNSAEFGEKVMQKALAEIETGYPLRLHSWEIHSECFSQ
ncbi:MAG: DUF503 domain-containing protein [Spirochaetes bacterium]|nr:DUF503 domain-containing protein [Spirochaetota bacterium]MBU0953787.1 DUF503 domain-containing protein [Spirochaetota bacterium]